MSAVSWDMAVGTEFAGYRITGLLGRGGMSIVYSAEHIRLGRQVALKVLSPALAADEGFRERFTRESQLAAGLDHPNIIAIYDAGEAEGVLYIAMRLVRGEDLGSMIEREGALSLGKTLFLIEQVGSALDQAHEQGLIHRDVKPANILIEGSSDRVYLTDFGVVKQTSSRGLTKTGYFLGTFEYAAPEQIQGKEVDRRTDVYALGCVLYECLSGEAPFSADTEGSVIHSHLVEPPPKVTPKRAELPIGVNDVIATAMAKAKDDRYASCGQLARSLRSAATGGGTFAGEHAVSSPTVRGAATVLAGSDAAAPPTGGATPTGPGTPAGATAASSAAPPPQPPAAPPPPSDGSGSLPGELGPESPRPSSKETRTVEVTGRRLTGLMLGLLVLVAAAVVAAVLLTRNNDHKSSTPPTTTTTPGTAGTADNLLAVLAPTQIAKTCTKTEPPSTGALETDDCKSPPTAAESDPNTFQLNFYPGAHAMNAAYDKELAKAKSTGFAECGKEPGSSQPWVHISSGKLGGKRFCWIDTSGNYVIVWTHEKRGSEDHVDMLATATEPSRAPTTFTSWWTPLKEFLGKCRPKGSQDVCLNTIQAITGQR
jgi:serine/threonine protein kinase